MQETDASKVELRISPWEIDFEGCGWGEFTPTVLSKPVEVQEKLEEHLRDFINLKYESYEPFFYPIERKYRHDYF